MPFWGKVSSTRVPGCQCCTVVTRTPRGLTFSVNVISFGTDSSARESSAANLFGIRLSDRPSDRRVGTGVPMNPGDLPEHVWSAASPQANCEDVTSWSAQMYTAFVGVNHSWPGWNALRSLPH